MQLTIATRLLTRGLSSKSRSITPVLNAKVAALSSVRLVDASGADQGVMSGTAAYERAKHDGLDVLQVSRSHDNVPVVKLLTYDAMPKPNVKKVKSKPTRHPKLKQVRLSPATDTGDLQLKLRQSRQFLINGHRVRVFMQFRRGHGKLRENAINTLCGIAEALVPSAAKLRSGELISLRETFTQPPNTTQPNDTAPRIHKPLEVYFEPLSKAQRTQLVEQ